jgi:hypothetical protein
MSEEQCQHAGEPLIVRPRGIRPGAAHRVYDQGGARFTVGHNAEAAEDMSVCEPHGRGDPDALLHHAADLIADGTSPHFP